MIPESVVNFPSSTPNFRFLSLPELCVLGYRNVYPHFVRYWG